MADMRPNIPTRRMRSRSFWAPFVVGGVTLTLTLVWTSLTIFTMSREIEEMRRMRRDDEHSRIRDAEKLATLSDK